MSANPRHHNEEGFSLIELMVALTILMVGLLGLAQVFYFGLAIVGTSSSQLIAREKAREAVESVHTARDTRTITWAEIRNATAPDCGAWPTTTSTGGGKFLTAEHDLLSPGVDGLVATADDAGTEKTPGPDNLMGTADDVPLQGFRRQVVICDIGTNLRQIAVTIRYNTNGAVGSRQRTYTLVTYISSFS
jgi:prepilin-type N-terminal cleavage/methylation domain-containing protein